MLSRQREESWRLWRDAHASTSVRACVVGGIFVWDACRALAEADYCVHETEDDSSVLLRARM